MARITVEDCIDKFPSRFELVLVASNRARKLHTGENATVEIDNDKNTVIALREIAEETITTEQLKNELIQEYQTNPFGVDEDLNEIEDNSNEIQTDTNQLDSNLSNQNDTIENDSIEETLNDTSQDNLEKSSDEDKEQD